jgi:hypothetical protein
MKTGSQYLRNVRIVVGRMCQAPVQSYRRLTETAYNFSLNCALNLSR